MTVHTSTDRRARLRRGVAVLAAAALVLGGCQGILDVDNPNNLEEENLNDPKAAGALAAGAGASVARSYGAMLGPYATVTDEVRWRGSRDAWLQLDLGNIADPANEFTDDAFRFVGEARWIADEAVRRIEAFDADGALRDQLGRPDRTPLVRAYLYAAIEYIIIADMFDDFALSDRREPSPPIGESNMRALYDQAIEYLDAAVTVANEIQADAAQSSKHALAAQLELEAIATRARAKFSKGLWDKVNPAGQIAADPLVTSPEAVADANLLLASAGADFRFYLPLDSDDLAYAGEASLAYNIQQRGELAIAPVFTGLTDPISNTADPRVQETIAELNENYVYQNITIASGREMLLILAEDALARGDMTAFATHINALRGLDNLPAWTGQIPAVDMLEYERQANLFLQGRRLTDMYRFGVLSPNWLSTATTVQTPGTFFPITCIEIRAHPQDFAGTSC